MQKSDFINIIRTGQISPQANFDEILVLTQKYPYSSTLHVLKALAAKQEDRIDQNLALEKAAVYIQDRKKLYAYIIKESLNKKIDAFSDSESVSETGKSEETEPAHFVDASKDTVPIKSDDLTESEKTPEAISSRPLEEQIMREAVMHLGEMETQRKLSTLAPADDGQLSKQESTEKKAPKSFGSWLLSLDEKHSSPSTVKLDKSLVDKFIQESPQISPVKAAFFSPSQVGKMSLMEDETFVTETLANIYEQQGDYKKAARAYKNLMLKYPEKSSYFAALQKKAEDQIKK